MTNCPQYLGDLSGVNMVHLQLSRGEFFQTITTGRPRNERILGCTRMKLTDNEIARLKTAAVAEEITTHIVPT